MNWKLKSRIQKQIAAMPDPVSYRLYYKLQRHLGELKSSDPTISSINFLQFTDTEWSSLAGNRYMYHNRLRFSEYRKLFESNGAVIREMQPYSDPEALDLLGKSTINLAEKFRHFEPEELAISRAWFTAGIDIKTSNV